ncbi:MAG: hypothetical protein JKY41_15910 [Rhodobacteraceae bacterium]|nr:hypothetical protein [Paracoccaceae bacterium]
MTSFIEIPASKRSLALRRPLCGIGINDANYMVFPRVDGNMNICPYYQSWANMIKRAYSSKTQLRQPTYKGCSVVKEWHTLSVFRSWMEGQDWQGKYLDKDLIVKGNKEYGPKTCLFVNRMINNLLTDSAANRGEYPQGVSLDCESMKYLSTCIVEGKQKKIGRFKSVDDAEIAYLEFKSNRVINISLTEEPIIRAALLRHAKIMTDRIEFIRVKDLPSNFNYQ